MKIYSSYALARYFRVNHFTVKRWLKKGLHSEKRGKRDFITHDQLLSYLAQFNPEGVPL